MVKYLGKPLIIFLSSTFVAGLIYMIVRGMRSYDTWWKDYVFVAFFSLAGFGIGFYSWVAVRASNTYSFSMMLANAVLFILALILLIGGVHR